MTPSLRRVRWHRHVNGVNPPSALRHWLTGAGSLTVKLQAHSQHFRVQRLHQRRARCLADEALTLGLKRVGAVWEREVLLRCDNSVCVFAHTVVPLTATAADWPLFSTLGERSLGSILFGDHRVRRATLEYARLRRGHPLAQGASAALGDALSTLSAPILYARRCLYRRGRSVLLVTEVFLPALSGLRPRTKTHN